MLCWGPLLCAILYITLRGSFSPADGLYYALSSFYISPADGFKWGFAPYPIRYVEAASKAALRYASHKGYHSTPIMLTCGTIYVRVKAHP